jgi:hypothetical protein
MIIPDEIRAIVSSRTDEAEAWLDFFRVWTPSSEEEREQSADAMRQTNDRLKELEVRRKAITDPLHRAKTEVDNLFRPARSILEEVKAALKGGLERGAALQLAAYSEAIEARDVAAAIPPAPPPGVAYRHDHEIVVVDESLVPDEYWCLDWSALRIAAKEGKEVAGVEFRATTKAVLTGGKR